MLGDNALQILLADSLKERYALMLDVLGVVTVGHQEAHGRMNCGRKKMRICLIQCDPTIGRENLAVLNHVVTSTDADLYILPELFTCGYPLPSAAAPEDFIAGRLYPEIAGLQLKRPQSAIVYGFWEAANGQSYNAAAVIADVGAAEVYRQVCPADASRLDIVSGAWRSVSIGSVRFGNLRKIGLMICSDYSGANEAFDHYSQSGVDAVVLIADSAAKKWKDTFPNLCSRYRIPAIVCNAAGPVCGDKGHSCAIDSTGRIVREFPEYAHQEVIDVLVGRREPLGISAANPR
jgi:predicted amidohydrolase